MAITQGPLDAQARDRIALVIGNSSYTVGKLRNPGNDAEAISAALRELNFEVTTQTDVTREQLVKELGAFGSRISRARVGALFFAGHGIQFDGVNYVLGVDAVGGIEDLLDASVSVDDILALMPYDPARVNILLLDACRNNPLFSERTSARSRGFAAMTKTSSGTGAHYGRSAPAGTVIGFATAPGSLAADGSGVNGLYTSALLQGIRLADTRIEDALREVRRVVATESNGLQIPWDNSSLTGDFYFNPVSVKIGTEIPTEAYNRRQVLNGAQFSADSGTTSEAPVIGTDGSILRLKSDGKRASTPERRHWESIRNTSEPDNFIGFYREFPNSAYGPLARARYDQETVAREKRLESLPPSLRSVAQYDGRWRGVLTCSSDPSDPYDKKEYADDQRILTIQEGRIASATGFGGGQRILHERWSGIIDSAAKFALRGTGQRFSRHYMISLTGEISSGVLRFEGRIGDRDCRGAFRQS